MINFLTRESVTLNLIQSKRVPYYTTHTHAHLHLMCTQTKPEGRHPPIDTAYDCKSTHPVHNKSEHRDRTAIMIIIVTDNIKNKHSKMNENKVTMFIPYDPINNEHTKIEQQNSSQPGTQSNKSRSQPNRWLQHHSCAN